MKRIPLLHRRFCLLCIVILVGLSPATAQTRIQSLADEIESLYRIDRLPRYRPNTIVAQVSSYDTTGGNNDGFSGAFSYIRKEGDRRLVIADLKGPGVIHRIWTPTPTDDTLSFYFDGEEVPRLRLRFSDLFSGKVSPFLKPVVGNEVGGYFSYIPIPYSRSLKIVFEGERIMFHQIQNRTYPAGTATRSFQPAFSDDERDRLDSARFVWTGKDLAVREHLLTRVPDLKRSESTFTLTPGGTVDLFTLARGGRIVGLELEPANGFSGRYKDVIIKAFWDGIKAPAIQSPVADFFGYAYGAPAMQSLVLGVRDGRAYCYLPMPFEAGARLQLAYHVRAGVDQPPVAGTVRVWYTEQAFDPRTEGRLFAVWRRELEPAVGRPYRILETTGRGHHVGTTLLAQGLNPGMTIFFEGDDVATVDGQLRIHGTGSEDAFNGGWYALVDRWDRGISLPIHGSLDYSLPMARTGGYRFYLTDKVSFERTYGFTIEHGPEGNAVPVDYTSVAFYYGNTAPASLMEPTEALRANTEPTVHTFYPQLLRTTPGGLSRITNPRYEDMAITSENDGLARIALDDVPNGRYRLSISYYEQPQGAPFAVWQRQMRIMDWKETRADSERYLESVAIGEIEVTDHIRTVTIHVRGNGYRDEFRFNRLILERVAER